MGNLSIFDNRSQQEKDFDLWEVMFNYYVTKEKNDINTATYLADRYLEAIKNKRKEIING